MYNCTFFEEIITELIIIILRYSVEEDAITAIKTSTRSKAFKRAYKTGTAQLGKLLNICRKISIHYALIYKW